MRSALIRRSVISGIVLDVLHPFQRAACAAAWLRCVTRQQTSTPRNTRPAARVRVDPDPDPNPDPDPDPDPVNTRPTKAKKQGYTLV